MAPTFAGRSYLGERESIIDTNTPHNKSRTVYFHAQRHILDCKNITVLKGKEECFMFNSEVMRDIQQSRQLSSPAWGNVLMDLS